MQASAEVLSSSDRSRGPAYLVSTVAAGSGKPVLGTVMDLNCERRAAAPGAGLDPPQFRLRGMSLYHAGDGARSDCS